MTREDFHMALEVERHDAARDRQTEIANQACPTCGGWGRDEMGIDCPDCDGEGVAW